MVWFLNRGNLDEDKIIKFIAKVNNSGRFNLEESLIRALEKLKLLKNNNPTSASLLLFAKEPPLCNIHIGRFKTPSVIISQKISKSTGADLLEFEKNWNHSRILDLSMKKVIRIQSGIQIC